jgi:hypothetical protein
VECTDNAHCPSATPQCDPTQYTCEQCLQDSHCRGGNTPPFDSPIGICTQDNTCTCAVGSTTGSCDDPESPYECPAGTFCAVDQYDAVNHFACLASCTGNSEPENGMECTIRSTLTDGDQRVWAPVTSCYAFYKFGDSCTENDNCNVTSSSSDGLCVEIDGIHSCTYLCEDNDEPQDSRCKEGASCIDDPFVVCQ